MRPRSPRASPACRRCARRCWSSRTIRPARPWTASSTWATRCWWRRCSPTAARSPSTCLKHQLLPSLYATAIAASETGVPTMPAPVLEFPDDPACATLDRQFHLGDALLVAPVFTDSGEVDVYLPAGRWTPLLSG